ncbi:transposable element Tcb1 transposase [Trichonephila clavipes]|nr:transposable element Tcb1 transposase [Trichonephila clavipes]
MKDSGLPRDCGLSFKEIGTRVGRNQTTVMRDGIGYHSRTPLVRIAGTLNNQCYISEVLEPVVLPYLQGLATAIFQQDNARPYVTRIVQRSFGDRKHVVYGCSTIDSDSYPPAATPNQLWQHVEAAWSAVPQEHIQSIEVSVGITFQDGDRFNSCQVIYSQFGLAIHQNDHQARRKFVEWAQNEIAVVPDFHRRILFSDEAHFWLNGYVNKQNCRIWSEANPQVYVETPLHPEKLTVWCALWTGGILLQKQ